MKAFDSTIADIVSGQKQYVIPVFQRYYEWEEERWKTFWNDLSALVYEYDNNMTHFIGPMVFFSNVTPTTVPKHLVVDGQQRIMTVFVLLAAIRDRALTLHNENLARSIETNSLFFHNRSGGQMTKIIPRMTDRDTLSNILYHDHEQIDKDSLLVKAYEYFSQEIERLTPVQQELFDEPPEDVLNKLDEATTQRLWIVQINLDANDNPSNIYESLNFKGKRLSDADLIRNYIFMQLEGLEKQEEFNNTTWGAFEKLFDLFGQESGERLTEFYYKYLISRTEYFSRKRLYHRFTAYVNTSLKNNKSLLQLVNELKQFAHYFISITHECKDNELDAAFKRFRDLKTDTAIPLLLHLYQQYKEPTDEMKALSKTQLLNMLRIIESFILRRSILRLRTRGYGLDFARACKHTQSLNSLMRYFAEKYWPTDQEIRKKMKGFAIYHHEYKKCHLILKEIERSFGHKEQIDLENTTVEHVLPQTLTSSWQKMLGVNVDKLYEKYVNTIGNLTLTGYNSELGNRSYEEKREMFGKSHIQLNTYFASCERWTEQEILERTDALTDKFIDLWIRPDEIGSIPKGPLRK